MVFYIQCQLAWLIDIISPRWQPPIVVDSKGDGSIINQEKTIMVSIGRWLRINGNAIKRLGDWRYSGVRFKYIQ
jgi:alpha-L-fucosidase